MRNAERLGLGLRRLRGRHADDVEAGLHLRPQKLHEPGGRRARAETELHPRLDELQRTLGGRDLHSVVAHVSSPMALPAASA